MGVALAAERPDVRVDHGLVNEAIPEGMDPQRAARLPE